ncbi:MAG TPA: hypothetical protein VN903_38705 [Polyangia bacterium]|nr:hypothetical protein [Polyangia bacterium]
MSTAFGQTLRIAAATVMAAGTIGCGHRGAAAPSPAPVVAASTPQQPPDAGANRACHCFDWVHRDEFGYECFDTAADCDGAHATSGFLDRTGCQIKSEYPQCVKVGCKNGKCTRYGDCPPSEE